MEAKVWSGKGFMEEEGRVPRREGVWYLIRRRTFESVRRKVMEILERTLSTTCQ